MLRRCGVSIGSGSAGVARRIGRAWPPRLLRRFVRRRDGATAVEFAMVLFPFVMILFMTMETAMVFFAQQMLETGVADAARLVQTGQTKSIDESAFRTRACSNLLRIVFSCDKLYVDVQNYGSSFSGIDTSVKVDAEGKPETQYQTSKENEVVVVRLMYQWPIVTALVQPYLANPNSTSRLLVATAAFRNEPFGN
ncbi:TadE family protein [Rhodovulum sp. PH10]|uniref:TadE family protein n=1 Tax=Rhodovulum sp. PH10 TaxID=1187851 RepID=UPI00068E4B0A|nr:TadE/TadG family type IV pilus assembly protein [Rhodovulum sp. PH10]